MIKHFLYTSSILSTNHNSPQMGCKKIEEIHTFVRLWKRTLFSSELCYCFRNFYGIQSKKKKRQIWKGPVVSRRWAWWRTLLLASPKTAWRKPSIHQSKQEAKGSWQEVTLCSWLQRERAPQCKRNWSKTLGRVRRTADDTKSGNRKLKEEEENYFGHKASN